jgi:hypothetical protein
MKYWIFIFALSIISVVTEAQTASKVDERQAVQRARVRRGVTSGEVSRPEARRLRGEQRHIRRVERRAKADGVVSKKESAKLRRKQNRASRNIRQEKRD